MVELRVDRASHIRVAAHIRLLVVEYLSRVDSGRAPRMMACFIYLHATLSPVLYPCAVLVTAFLVSSRYLAFIVPLP